MRGDERAISPSTSLFVSLPPHFVLRVTVVFFLSLPLAHILCAHQICVQIPGPQFGLTVIICVPEPFIKNELNPQVQMITSPRLNAGMPAVLSAKCEMKSHEHHLRSSLSERPERFPSSTKIFSSRRHFEFQTCNM